MLLAIDIGNTSVSFGVFIGRRLVKKWKISTALESYKAPLRYKISSRMSKDIDGVIISSVVPKALIKLEKTLGSLLSMKPVVLGRGAKVPIKNLYRDPKTVGQDRLVNAFFAARSYKGSSIVIDFGTAVTFDLITKRGEYAGGIIVPGMEISLEHLSVRAALLPKADFKAPRQLVGKDTVTSMQSGIFYGYAALCDGLIGILKERYGKNIRVIATGGHAKMLKRFAKNIDIVDEDLTLKGLEMIYRDLEVTRR